MCGMLIDLSSRRRSSFKNIFENGNCPTVPSTLTCLFPASPERLNSNLSKGGVSDPEGLDMEALNVVPGLGLLEE